MKLCTLAAGYGLQPGYTISDGSDFRKYKRICNSINQQFLLHRPVHEQKKNRTDKHDKRKNGSFNSSMAHVNG